ncbi:MAG: DMT family transporter [Chloroflexi bacterium]|nr:DMT family transporter [Chloroflexota bacterium]
MWTFLALATALLTSFNPILYKRLVGKAGPVVVVWGVIGLALPLLALFTWSLTPTLPRVDNLFVLTVFGAALLNVRAHLANARALQIADASLVAPLLTFSPVFTLLISLFVLGEIPTWLDIGGVFFVLIGAYWLNRGPAENWLAPLQALSLKPGVRLVLLAGLLWAITPVLEKSAIQHTSPASPQVVALAVNSLLVVFLTPIALGRNRSSLGVLFRHRRAWFLAALIAGVAPILGYAALNLGMVGLVTTLFRFSAVFTVIWGKLLLGEAGFAQKLYASIVMALGAILIAA